MKKTFLALLFIPLGVCASGQVGQSPGPFEDLNIEFMTRGYFYAGSRIEDRQALGGFGPSHNFPKTIDPEMSVRRGEVSLIALPDEEAMFGGKYRGLKVLLVNATGDQVGFPASDSRLSVVQEALDPEGRWKPVEYLPSSWCGNSYHTVFLGPHEYWEFAAAHYAGEFRTRLRFRLDWSQVRGVKQTIYSNEFEGGVNPKQFTVQQGHQPKSIMDPYNN